MDSLSLLVLLIFSSNSRGEVFSDGYYSFEEGVGSAPISADSDNSRQAQPVRSTSSTSQMSSPPGEDDYAEEEDVSNPLDEDVNTPGDSLLKAVSQTNVATSQGQDYYKNFKSNDTKTDLTPKRRDLNDWKESDEFFQVDNYNPRDGSPEFYEDPSYVTEKYVSEVGGKHPQYYQKNYYYNYYPLVNGRGYYVSGGPDVYTSEGGNRGNEISVPLRFRKMNPCRQYLEFLRYAFESLDRNVDYQYDYADYGDDWRDLEPQSHPGVFGSRLYGPTLYIDNSGKAFQLNNRAEGIPVDERIFQVTKDSIFLNGGFTQNPTILPSQETVEIDVHKGTEITTTFNPRWNDTGLHRSDFATEISSSFSDISKATTPTTLHDDIDNYQKWWKTLRTDSYRAQTVTYSLPDPAGETKGTFDEYEFSIRPSYPTTTVSPLVFTAGDYYGTLGGDVREKPEPTLYGINSSPYYWTSQKEEKTTIPTPIFSVSPTVNTFTSKTVINIDNSEGGERKESDCNDQMLPCPDTINITYPLNGYCNRYVACESGRAIRKTCPDGLHFNVIIKSCDVPHNSFCTYACPESNGFFGIPGDCSGYFVCKESIPEYRMCPPRMHWDPKRKICTFAELSRCPMKCVKANEVKHYEGDCKAYIVCLNGLPFYHKCPPNTKFDGKSLSCIPEKKSKCEDDPRLLTKNLNPSLLCRDVDIKIGPNTWCSYFTG